MLIRDDHKPKLLLAALISVATIFLIFKLHGFSIGYWHTIIGGDIHRDVLLGEPRGIRSDDWLTFIPLAFSQIAHAPQFPVINTNIGLGHNMLLPISLPVWHIVTIFRPTMWGYFIGPDIGLSWHWLVLLLGLYYSYYLLFMLLTRNMFWLSALSALILPFSAFLQYWSLNAGTYAIFGCLMVFFSTKILLCKTRWQAIALFIALIWASAAFLLNIYPPYQVSIVYAMAFIFAVILVERHREILTAGPLNIILLCSAVGLGLLFFIPFYSSCKEVFAVMANTSYPGRRVSLGGDLDLTTLFLGNFIPHSFVTNFASTGTNECEVSSFIFFFPFLILSTLLTSWFTKRKLSAGFLILCGFFLLFMGYGFIGVPEWLSKLALLSYVPTKRAFLALGIIDTTLLVVVIRDICRSDSRKLAAIITFFSTLTFLGLIGLNVSRQFIELTPYIWPVATMSALIVFLLTQRVTSLFALTGFVGLLIYLNGLVNPLVQDGSSSLFRSKISRKIQKIQKTNLGSARWVVFDSLQLGPLLPLLGVKSISTIYPYPQNNLWAHFDRAGTNTDIYNRYAYTVFLASKEENPEFELAQADTFFIKVSPQDLAFKELDVKYFITSSGSRSAFQDTSNFRPLGQVRGFYFYERID